MVNEDLVREVEEKIRENRRFTITSLSLLFPQISLSLLHKIVSDNLKFRKLCARWVPHRRRHHSTMKGYKNWCNTMTSASTMVETMSKSSVRYVHQMAIYMVCSIFLFFFLTAHRNLLSG
jgi:hypothetical protein